jgi:hypothetical protein
MQRRLVVLVLTRQGLWDQGVRFGITGPFNKRHVVLINPGCPASPPARSSTGCSAAANPGADPGAPGAPPERCSSPLRCVAAQWSGCCRPVTCGVGSQYALVGLSSARWNDKRNDTPALSPTRWAASAEPML